MLSVMTGLWDFAILPALGSVEASYVQGQLLFQWQRLSEGRLLFLVS